MIQRSTDDPTPIRRHPAAVAVGIQGTAGELVEHGIEISERMSVRKKIDRRSDACFRKADAYCEMVKRDPANAVEYARCAQEWIARGLELDALEDEHCDITFERGTQVEHGGRQIVTVIHAQLGGRVRG